MPNRGKEPKAFSSIAAVVFTAAKKKHHNKLSWSVGRQEGKPRWRDIPWLWVPLGTDNEDGFLRHSMMAARGVGNLLEWQS